MTLSEEEGKNKSSLYILPRLIFVVLTNEHAMSIF